MTKRIERKRKMCVGAAAIQAAPQNLASPGRSLKFLALPLPLPDYRRTPRWPGRGLRPEDVLYFVDYTILPGQWPDDDASGQTRL